MTPTREQVTQWALNAGCVSATFWPHDFSGLLATFERFAAIAHAAGREQGLREAADAVKALHAKVADPIFGQERHDIGHAVIDNCAAAIEQLRRPRAT